ncbi:FKBP-type peptidyl-prolyl cis-trans isomerase FkpA [Spirosoma fluviale]|uniref:Peptidyl-prolyl cis-trans isomerase n=1 Tax=Spirosoma fluviale TaxID=1597977 RepID=A0A286FFH8_9BACT|nr:FKBP-type peptidyl-prolyl cis-trans isomerase FkpA [Spirosoma fluviale]
MKKKWLILVVCSLLAGGCQQADRVPCTETAVTTKAPDEEIKAVKQFIETGRIKAKADSRGFYYAIQSAGVGAKPTVCSNVTVNYSGRLTNGKVFDSAEDIRFDLNQLIVGWQEGIPLIAPGGKIVLYLPPSLAYGAQEQNDIPANSILVFEIDLIDIN